MYYAHLKLNVLRRGQAYKMLPEQTSLMNDPRVLGALVAALLTFLAPTIRDFWITNRTKKNLVKILTVDVSARINKIDKFLIPFQAALNKAKTDKDICPRSVITKAWKIISTGRMRNG